ncbi:cadherin domain-containing protein [Phthorimaea operculella]|nr:cadherin domain-containing protein [Phthorimaea operculella]
MSAPGKSRSEPVLAGLNRPRVRLKWVVYLLMMCVGVQGNRPPRFLIDGQSEIVVRLKEGPDTPVGSLIYRLRGVDPDGDVLKFGIRDQIGSDILRLEAISSNEANIYLVKELDREIRDEYSFVLTLTDGHLGEGNYITQSFLLLVEDVNDNEPIFKPYPSAITVKENANPGILATVEATDLDEGAYGQVLYHLQELDGDVDNFAIQTVNGKGVIRLTNKLDYERKSLYQLRVLAVDRANQGRVNTGTAAILVKVQDVEDQPPEFVVVSPVTRISEDAPVGTSVLQVRAIDGDRGINNRISYSIISGGEEHFDIDSSSGIVYTVNQLDREDPNNSNGAYILEILATEESRAVSPMPSATTEVTIIVTDVNDEIPRFRSERYIGEVLENAQQNTPITFLQDAIPEVFDYDQGKNGTFELYLVGDNGVFDVTPFKGINEASFLIRVNDPSFLDYEAVTVMNFSLVAKEIVASEPKMSVVPIMVHIKDENDNFPEFTESLYTVSIPENCGVGTTVAWVQALDQDSDNYGTRGIRYTSLGGSVANLLNLNPVTGVITVKQAGGDSFDRELNSRHYLTVEARDDLGKGNRNTAQLIINIEDVNDNAPMFLANKYEARLLENEVQFENPLVLEARDIDLNGTKNSHIEYSIVNGDYKANFTIDPNLGIITPLGGLDFEQIPGDNSNLRPIHLTANFSIDPNLGIITPLGGLDFEQIPGDNSNLRPIHLTANFSIDPNLGIITPLGGLDFEQIPGDNSNLRPIHLTVRARDFGTPSLSSTVPVTIYVQDVNDHAPMFQQMLYKRSIPEDMPGGTSVLEVKARDGDGSSPNNRIVYRIQRGASDKFVIDSRTGVVSVANGSSLDPDRTNPKSNKYTLTVINKCFRVSWVSDKFVIDSKTGVISVANGSSLDPDRTNPKSNKYTLTVVALDGGIGDQQLSAAVLVNITIVDVNNKPPVFVEPGTITVKENTQVGTEIFRAQAYDPDDQPVLRYSIDKAASVARDEDGIPVPESEYDHTALWDLNSVDGTLRIVRLLDREKIETIKLVLTVEDMAAIDGGPPQTASATLTINVEDENDNNPRFRKPFYKTSIPENSKNGANIATVIADDADKNRTMSYYLEGPEDLLSMVHLDRATGEVVVGNRIDHELYPWINLTVKAVDSGVPPRYSVVDLFIQVLDENDNNPVFDTAAFEYRVREDVEPGTTITTIFAKDADSGEYGKITYLLDRISTQGKFLINAETGALTVSDWLDRETTPTYNLVVEAWDNYQFGYLSGESRNAFKQIVVHIEDVNDNPPILHLPTDCTTISEFHNHREAIVAVSATDADNNAAPNGRVQFHLVGGKGHEKVNDNSQILHLPSDYTTISEFHNHREAIVAVSATDADDNSSPNGRVQFHLVGGKKGYEFHNHREAIVAVSATDADDNAAPNGRVQFHLVGGKGYEFHNHRETIVAVSATDADDNSSPNGRVQFHLVGGMGYEFHNHREAIVAVSATDADDNSSPNGRVQFHLDGGKGYEFHNHREAIVAVSATDTDDNAAPNGRVQFHLVGGKGYEFHNHREAIVAVSATDADDNAAPNGRVQFHLVGGKGYDLFRFEQVGGDANTGRLFAKQSLKDRFGNYTLLVEARDLGTPPNVVKGELRLCVTDYNDHAPVFVHPPQNVTVKVPENATIGTVVVEVKAIDADIGPNGAVRYRVRQDAGGAWRSFTVHATSGALRTTRALDRDQQALYQVTNRL